MIGTLCLVVPTFPGMFALLDSPIEGLSVFYLHLGPHGVLLAVFIVVGVFVYAGGEVWRTGMLYEVVMVVLPVWIIGLAVRATMGTQPIGWPDVGVIAVFGVAGGLLAVCKGSDQSKMTDIQPVERIGIVWRRIPTLWFGGAVACGLVILIVVGSRYLAAPIIAWTPLAAKRCGLALGMWTIFSQYAVAQ